MSLWLQAVTEALDYGEYERLHLKILPSAPIRIPGCLLQEVAFAERRCRDRTKDKLFPIRFQWLLEAHEQRLFGLRPSGRSRYHPEKLLELWTRASSDIQYRHECETSGMRFDLSEKAMTLSVGWIYVGEQFVEDFLEVEATLGIELMFPDSQTGDNRPAFQNLKRPRTRDEGPD